MARSARPIWRIVAGRVAAGGVTLLMISAIVFVTTQVLPGNAAYAVLGRTATPARLRALESQLHLNEPATQQYWAWLTGLLHGNAGNSLVTGTSVTSQVDPRLLNTLILVLLAGGIGTVTAVILGLIAAMSRNKLADHVLSGLSLGITALPEFVVAVLLVILFATTVSHLLPAVTVIGQNQSPFSDLPGLVLPVLTLVIVIEPYIFRMMRAAAIEALESDYVQMARLKGLHPVRVLLRHTLPNAVPPTIQVVGLTFLYLAGGVVVVEYVFNYPGIGQGLVNAVSDRDIPTIQFTVLVLAAFYITVNIATDMIALAASPRRRAAR
jgi:peptide/nickel transport system permease protein